MASAADDGEFDSIPLVGRSPAMQEIYRVLARLMQTDLTVMISGESGTGKELVARALHDYGKRRNGPFVRLNCAAIPMDLLESELFGHEKGAFTGAVTHRIGRFEAANGGTLFLDEIGDMPAALQAKLLRVLQEQEFERLGSSYTRRVDVRVLAATHQDLNAMVADGRVVLRRAPHVTIEPGLVILAVDFLRERAAVLPKRRDLDDEPGHAAAPRHSSTCGSISTSVRTMRSLQSRTSDGNWLSAARLMSSNGMPSVMLCPPACSIGDAIAGPVLRSGCRRRC